MFRKLIQFSINHPKVIIAITAVLAAIAILQFPRIKVDTDPENMLSEKEFVRVYHRQVKKEFAIYDFIVLGIVNEKNPRGIFNVGTINKIYRITEGIKVIEGVVTREIIAPSTKDNIRQAGPGTLVFEWLMDKPIATDRQALRLRDEMLDNPMFKGTMISEDGKALCLYIPIEEKNMSYRISRQIQDIIKGFKGEEKYYITGLPVAENTFGVQMFKQMAISAPLAGLIIFLLMLLFFKKINLVISPMLLAVIVVVITMGLLIGLGFPVHIMSSMIPIFLMPISVLDSVHILSEFFDRFPSLKNKRIAILAVMDELFKPMLFTSLTSGVGFLSLASSPIPPVQIFGVFVAAGIMLAWVLTLTFIPAYIALIPEKRLAGLSMKRTGKKHDGLLDKILASIGRFAYQRAKFIIGISVLAVVISLYGISKIRVNDNPVKWFTQRHPIRIADNVLNKHFGGTYTAYLIFEAKDRAGEIFKEPQMLRYIEKLQQRLLNEGYIGKSTSLADIVKKVYYELLGGDKQYNLIPQTKAAVSQCLLSYENSHKPDDLWHMVTPDYSKLNLWIQLKSGDNQDMERVLRRVDKYINNHKPPFELSYNWAGLTYINAVWQDKMVVSMLRAFLGSFIIVFFMMAFLFHSPVRGLISMIPLTVTIVLIYGLLGITGKDYDMPVAVLSALTLGLSIDFAIHFIQRARNIFARNNNWPKTNEAMFQEPGRAITRNALVIAIGFLPLLFAPLVPYKTVGFFMFSIMFISGIATLFILPAIITIFPKAAFEEIKEGVICKCKYCVVISIAVAAAVAYVLADYTTKGWRPITFICLGIIGIAAGLCSLISKHKFCIAKKGE